MTITCREFIEFLMDYLAGELPEAQKSAFDDHLAVCPSCVAYLNTYAETIKLGKESFSGEDDSPPDDAPPELIHAILEAKKRSGQ